MINRIRKKVSVLNCRIDDMKNRNNGKVPKGKNFIATILDFTVMKNLENMTEEEFREYYGTKTEAVLSHLEGTIDCSIYDYISKI